MTTTRALLGLIITLGISVFSGCTNETSTRQQAVQQQDSHPSRFVGTWLASKDDFYNDNYALLAKGIKDPEAYANFLRMNDSERKAAFDELLKDNPLVNRKLRFMDNGFVEVTVSEKEKIVHVSIWKWAYEKGEIKLRSDEPGAEGFKVYELAGELLEETLVDKGAAKGAFKVRFIRVP